MMATDCTGPHIRPAGTKRRFCPDGFSSHTSFTLKKNLSLVEMDMFSLSSAPLGEKAGLDTKCSEDVKVARSLRRRPWINYAMFDVSSEEESQKKPTKLKQLSLTPLKKGVIRGCPNCNNCQKVIARWDPENARRQVISEAPVFYPNEEEFKDPLKYIASIRQTAESYGICRIVPPPFWKPPCILKQKHIWENAKFATRIQQLDKLQNRKPMKKRSRNIGHIKKRKKRCLKMGISCSPSDTSSADIHESFDESEIFGFLPGPEFTLESFQKYADDFIGQYFGMNDTIPMSSLSNSEDKHGKGPSVDDIEGEYWRMVENPTEEIEVLYGADLETGTFSSGFPKGSTDYGDSEPDVYVKSGWNLNNLPRLAGSLLSFEQTDISGVLVPWLYIGMCFSSFCWHVEDHHLYSLNYMHMGAPKLWYSVPGNHALKLEAAMKKHLPGLFKEQPDLLHKLVTQFSPMILKLEGVPVYRCVQQSGEFVLTFPRAYHSGFNCGFNCAEAVNVAPIDWLPHGQSAVELYCQQFRKTSLSHDKLLLGAAREAVRALWELHILGRDTPHNLQWSAVCGKDAILTMALKTRIDLEHRRRKFFCSPSQVRKMDVSFDATNERECVICFYDLHLSAVGCECSPETFACLDHAKQLCSCDWSTRFFLFRYELSELNLCMEALGGKLNAIHRWANLDLRLSLSSYVKKEEKFQGSEKTCALLCKPSLREMELKKHMPLDDASVQGPASVSVLRIETNKLLMQPACLGTTEVKDRRTPNKVEELTFKRETFVFEEDKARIYDMTELGKVISDDGQVFAATEVQAPCNDFKPIMQNVHGNDGPSVSKSITESFSVFQSRSEDTPCAQFPESSSILLQQSIFSPAANNTTLKILEKENSRPATFHGGTICLNDDGDDDDSDQMEKGHNLQVGVEVEGPTTHLANSGGSRNCIHHLLSDPHRVPSNLKKDELPLSDSSSTIMEHDSCMQFIVSSTESSVKPNLGRNCESGPQIAKVVRNLNCEVEPLDFGLVVPGKAWCNKYAIFPKGFRSRVRYLSVIDPTQGSHYISEILDVGISVPFFRVTLEDCPSEVFMCVSAINCWDMVRDKVNQKIVSQHRQGKLNLPPLHPPGSIDGFDMFGFSTPFIVQQKIEALDPNHLCLEYWNCQPTKQKPVKVPPGSSTKDNQGSTKVVPREGPIIKNSLEAVECILKGIFKKANREELRALQEALSNENACLNKDIVIKFLKEEIQESQNGKFGDIHLCPPDEYLDMKK
ncbi:lysine-specific demethylase JMJ18-like isoform X1 [Nymphaea colorata]|nr:lysine-specific demethylase JMJ18-like isoform X1 [Nymphaea colorata]XP_031482472.1 lysine-specific demethylase JMJ18-like isoform X1 [Nymphaea colorata]